MQDLANASPAQGWRGLERKRFEERISADALLALAVIHHMCLTRRIPLTELVAWLIGFAPAGLIEFAPSDDPLARAMVSDNAPAPSDYSHVAFESAMKSHAQIVSVKNLEGTERRLYEYQRR